jgi:hypothetical protein
MNRHPDNLRRILVDELTRREEIAKRKLAAARERTRVCIACGFIAAFWLIAISIALTL